VANNCKTAVMIILRKLKIKDLAIVSEAEVAFNSGLSVITGETGAGKSLLVGAIDLLLGERGRSDVVRSGKARAVIEGEFEGDFSRLNEILSTEDVSISGNLLTITREISADGRSRCLINDQRVSVGMIKQVGESICDLHGQHQHQWLLDTSKHLWFLDRFAGKSGLAARYEREFSGYRDLVERVETVTKEIAANRQLRELQTFQLAEIDDAAVSAVEEEELERERRELENVNRIKERLFDSGNRIEDEGGALESTAAVLKNLTSLTSDFPAAKSIIAELESARISLAEIARQLAEHLSRLAEDPARLEQIGGRLALIYDLKRKYGGTVESVLAYRDQTAAALEKSDSLESELKDLQQEAINTAVELIGTATDLQAARSAAAKKLSAQLQDQLKQLGMPQSQFSVEFYDPPGGIMIQGDSGPVTLFEIGPKAGRFLFSANPGEEPRPLARIASGGEISRVMLALKSLITGNDQVDLLVFDEIDVGIGGKTALLVGKQLKELAGGQQVITITHLQQLAAFADHHYRVVKRRTDGRTESTLEMLGEKDRVAELGRMISGGSFGQEERRQAEKLLAQARGKRKVSIDK
jgi:DNA repair protein RecN (Recombination protein N)